MKQTLETKLAAMIQHQQQVHQGIRDLDSVGFNSYLNDPEIIEWVDSMEKNGFIGTTRFTRRRDGR